MAEPMARANDPHACPEHGAGTLNDNLGRKVTCNGLASAHTGDAGLCATGDKDFVVTGAATVTIHGKPAARAGSHMLHQGVVVGGSGNVVIGGPGAGSTLGSPDEQTVACAAAANTRASGSRRQTYGNCGPEAWRNAINKQRAAQGLPPVTEQELMDYALANELARSEPGTPHHGATTSSDRVRLLGDFGISATRQSQELDAIRQAVAERKGVTVTVTPWYWRDPRVNEDWVHEVAVTAVEYDEHGAVKHYVINDTGIGACGLELSPADFERALRPGGRSTVTDGPTW